MTEKSPTRIVIIDNYDSYAYNLFQAFGELTGEAATVVRNDRITLAQLEALEPTHVVISPGPGNPEDDAYFGVSRQAILALGRTIPVLGVCLGHQGIGAAWGGRIVRAPRPMHGKTSQVHHNHSPIFGGVSAPFVAMRYHSLVIAPETLPDCLQVIAATSDRIIMGVAHRQYPVVGLQFHPESIGTVEGLGMLRNFVEFGRERRPFVGASEPFAPLVVRGRVAS